MSDIGNRFDQGRRNPRGQDAFLDSPEYQELPPKEKAVLRKTVEMTLCVLLGFGVGQELFKDSAMFDQVVGYLATAGLIRVAGVPVVDAAVGAVGRTLSSAGDAIAGGVGAAAQSVTERSQKAASGVNKAKNDAVDRGVAIARLATVLPSIMVMSLGDAYNGMLDGMNQRLADARAEKLGTFNPELEKLDFLADQREGTIDWEKVVEQPYLPNVLNATGGGLLKIASDLRNAETEDQVILRDQQKMNDTTLANVDAQAYNLMFELLDVDAEQRKGLAKALSAQGWGAEVATDEEGKEYIRLSDKFKEFCLGLTRIRREVGLVRETLKVLDKILELFVSEKVSDWATIELILRDKSVHDEIVSLSSQLVKAKTLDQEKNAVEHANAVKSAITQTHRMLTGVFPFTVDRDFVSIALTSYITKTANKTA